MSERRASRLVELDRSSYRYEPRADHNAERREELVKLARQKPRYGYRRRIRRVHSGFTGCIGRNG
jgi:putative transposase